MQKFSELSPATKKIIVIFAGVAAALGPVIYILGTLLTMAPAIGAAFTVMMGPVGLIIAGLTAVSVVIYKNWAGIKQALVNIGNYFIDLYNNSLPIKLAVNALIMNFKNMLAVGKFVFSTFLTIIKTFASNFITIFKGIGDILMGVFTFDKDKIVQGFTDLTSGLKNNFTNAFDAIKTDASILGGSVVDNFNEALKSKTIAKIVIPVEMAVSGGATTSGDAANGGGGVSTRPMATSALDGVNAAGIQTPISDMVAADNERLPTVLGEQQALFMGFTMSFQTAMDSVRRISGAVSQSFSQIGNSIANAFGGAQSAMGAFLGTLAKDALKIVGHNLSVSMSNSITGATQSAKSFGPAAAFVLPALIAGATSLISGAFSGIKGGGGGGRRAMGSSVGGYAGGGNSGVVTGFANGGIISGPTMGLVGEYPGARQNPEVIAPLNKLQSIIGKSNNGGNLNVTGQVRIDGQDLLIAIERANETAGRIY